MRPGERTGLEKKALEVTGTNDSSYVFDSLLKPACVCVCVRAHACARVCGQLAGVVSHLPSVSRSWLGDSAFPTGSSRWSWDSYSD